MKHFEVLFDHGEPSARDDPAYEIYGRLGFPSPPGQRPWIYSNFVQSLDGIASFLGKNATGSHISRSEEDRWLMNLLRAHADAVLLGVRTLLDETALAGEQDRGPVYNVGDESLRSLRSRLGRGRELNVFVTGAATLDLARYRVFDGDLVQSVIITTREGAARLEPRKTHAHVRVIVAGEGGLVDLRRAVEILYSQFGVRYLVCEGGPTLSGYMSRAGLIDERFLTISPIEVGQGVPPEQEPSSFERAHPPTVRPTTFNAPGFLADNAPWWTWLSCRKVGDHQFNRYRRKR
jgi:riboflavin biosynthesis pyrimidine reductase